MLQRVPTSRSRCQGERRVPALWVTLSHGSSGDRISASTAVPTPSASSQGGLERDFKFSCPVTQLPEASPSRRSPRSHPRVFCRNPSTSFGQDSPGALLQVFFSLQCDTRFHLPSNHSLRRARDFCPWSSLRTEPNLSGAATPAQPGRLTHSGVRGKENTRELIPLIPHCQSCMDSPPDIWQRLPGWSNPSTAARGGDLTRLGPGWVSEAVPGIAETPPAAFPPGRSPPESSHSHFPSSVS